MYYYVLITMYLLFIIYYLFIYIYFIFINAMSSSIFSNYSVYFILS